ncbi:MAG: DMT family transporter [Minisyncoccia bacterium]|jgi:drug/metabolite transporter (DMT)-like permease
MEKRTFWYATFLALLTMVVSGTNNFLTKIAVTAVKDPVLYTTLKNSIVAVFLFGLVVLFKKWPEIRGASKKQLLQLTAIGIVGGSVPFALYFSGLAQTTAVNASLIHATLLIWVFLFAIPMFKERMGCVQWLGVGAIFAANLFVGGFTGFKYNTGELMILIATVLWGAENIIAKSALRGFSSTTVVAARMVLGSFILLLISLPRGGATVVLTLNAAQWGWTLLTSALLLGYVLSWYAALKYAPATYVATLLVPAPLITNALSAVFVTHSLQWTDAASSLLYAVGVVLVIVFSDKIAKEILPRKALASQTASFSGKKP